MDEPASRVDVIDPTDELDDAEDEIVVTRVQIEQTRAEMSDTIDAIKEKLSPPHLMQEAKESVREATSNFAHQTVDKAKETVSGAVESAREAVSGVVDSAREKVGSAMDSARQVVAPAVDTARETGSNIMDMIKENPMPVALIGVGLGWLYMNQRNRHSAAPRRYDGSSYRGDRSQWSSTSPVAPGQEEWRSSSSAWPSGQSREAWQGASASSGAGGAVQAATEAVGQKLQGVQEQVSQIGARAQQGAGQVADSAQRLLYENPLAAAAVALALGAGLGLAIPQTPQENRLMGEARDQLVDRAQETASELGHKVQAVAGEAMDSAKEAARSQGLAS